jgi:hypothetical protein
MARLLDVKLLLDAAKAAAGTAMARAQTPAAAIFATSQIGEMGWEHNVGRERRKKDVGGRLAQMRRIRRWSF